jgi:hypothetical protein
MKVGLICTDYTMNLSPSNGIMTTTNRYFGYQIAFVTGLRASFILFVLTSHNA